LAHRFVGQVCCVAWAFALPITVQAAGFDSYLVPDIANDNHIALAMEESVLVQNPESNDTFVSHLRNGDSRQMTNGTQLGNDPVDQATDSFQTTSVGSIAADGEPIWDDQGAQSHSITDGALNRILGDVCPRWGAQVDALFLWQGAIPSQPLLADANGTTVLDANQAQTKMTSGPRYGVFFHIDKCSTIEGNYFNVGSFYGDAPAIPAAVYTGIGLPITLPLTPTAYSLLTNGRIQSAELNWRQRSGGPLTMLAGFRWVEWNQQLQMLDSLTAPTTGTTAITGNDLYGGQLGADLLLWNSGGRVTVNALGKAGVFYNKAYQRTSGIEASILQGPVAAVADQTSFFGEAGANGSVRLTDWLSWRAGYSLFWLSGVATSADQLSRTTFTPPTATINTHGSVLLHGVTTGLESRW